MPDRMRLMANRLQRLEVAVSENNNWTPSSEDLLIPRGQRRTIMQLNEHTCRWPVGNPTEPSFFFCGGDTEQGWAYCPMHRARASFAASLAPTGRQQRAA
ncbi:MAG TPA: GcrA family cell cycle regulator [Terracidiphilus sp.]|jgi:GcrA cell cycle regulator